MRRDRPAQPNREAPAAVSILAPLADVLEVGMPVLAPFLGGWTVPHAGAVGLGVPVRPGLPGPALVRGRRWREGVHPGP